MRSKVDPEKVAEQIAAAAFHAYARVRGLNKTWEQLEAKLREAWRAATDTVAAHYLAPLDEQETFLVMLKLAMRDALADDHISQIQATLAGGVVRIIIAPDRISMQFAQPLRGREDS